MFIKISVIAVAIHEVLWLVDLIPPRGTKNMADIDNDLDADLLGLVGDDEPVAEPEPARQKPEYVCS